jgi:hypothetical protein
LALRLSEGLGLKAAAPPSASEKHAPTTLYKSIT